MTFGRPKMIKNIPPYEITFQEALIQKVMSYNYLGMTLDSQLNYKLHVKKIISNVSGKLKQFQKMRNFLETRAAVLVCKSMLLPLLEYGDIFLSATTAKNRKKLQVLQNKRLRCALNKGAYVDSNELHEEAKLYKLEFRQEQHLLNLMFDWAQNPKMLRARTAGAVKTRSQNKKLLYSKKPRTEKFKACFAYQGPKKWNTLPVTFHQAATKESYKLLVGGLMNQKIMVTFS